MTGVYRAALDRVLRRLGRLLGTRGERAVLAESFSRGFSEAYLVGERGNDDDELSAAQQQGRARRPRDRRGRRRGDGGARQVAGIGRYHRVLDLGRPLRAAGRPDDV